MVVVLQSNRASSEKAEVSKGGLQTAESYLLEASALLLSL